MKHAAAPRVAGEVCLLLLLYCLFAPAYGQLWLLAVFPAAILICGLTAMRCNRAILRLLCCLPAAVLILAADRPAALIALAVCWVFAAVRFTVGRFEVEYWVFRREFAFLTAVAFVASILVATGIAFRVKTPPGVLGFAAASVLLGIFSLRVIRLGSLEEPRWIAYSALELVLPLGVATGLSVLVWLLCRAFLYALEWLVGLAGDESMPTRPPSTPNLYTHNVHYEARQNAGNIGNYVMEELPEPSPTPEPGPERIVRRLPPWVWLILLAVVLAVVIVLIVRRLRRRKAARKRALSAEDAEEAAQRHGRRWRTAGLSPEQRIRSVYRSYLRLLQQQGQTIRNSDTSLDVLAETPERGDREADRALRALYLRARYGEGAGLTGEDAEAAEGVLEAIRRAYAR